MTFTEYQQFSNFAWALFRADVITGDQYDAIDHQLRSLTEELDDEG